MDAQTFRDAMARWPTGVTVVAYRGPDRVIATTVSAFMSLSIEPALVLLALAPNATVRPFLAVGAEFGISMLGAEQRRLASVFADPFPVGPDPFDAQGMPLVRDALVALSCTVQEIRPGGDHAVVIAAVSDVRVTGDDPLVRCNRAYRRLADGR